MTSIKPKDILALCGHVVRLYLKSNRVSQESLGFHFYDVWVVFSYLTQSVTLLVARYHGHEVHDGG